MAQCKICGSHAFNLRAEGIDQGELCDRHYWQEVARLVGLDFARLCKDFDEHDLELKRVIADQRVELSTAKRDAIAEASDLLCDLGLPNYLCQLEQAYK